MALRRYWASGFQPLGTQFNLGFQQSASSGHRTQPSSRKQLRRFTSQKAASVENETNLAAAVTATTTAAAAGVGLGWSSNVARRQRLRRELERIGLDESALALDSEHELNERAKDAVESYLRPQTEEELAIAAVPGQARFVASRVAEAVMTVQADSNEELCNEDRTAEELELKSKIAKLPLTIILHGLTSETVGCLIRTCEAAKVSLIIISNDTPGPPDPRVLKTSLRAEDYVSHQRYEGNDLGNLMDELRADGLELWGMAPASSAVQNGCTNKVIVDLLDSSDQALQGKSWPRALFVGNEPGGALDPSIADKLDVLVHLGNRESPPEDQLGAAISASVVIYDMLRQWNNYGTFQ
eukprot:TRINITY_DN18820_c0_g1_i1.p1 TRINITY_DN18820_c0_g1~~TRINITY_DN18820_c0_g1_i1.p1  ORF type:complete len:355 (-),score=74.30 TRINITY_DN18820_c0_g1_i1:34-1098(-)